MACKWEAKWKGTPPHTHTHINPLAEIDGHAYPSSLLQLQTRKISAASRESASRFLSQYFLITAVQSLVRTCSNTCQNTTVELWPSALSFYVINYENCSTSLRANCKGSPFVSSLWLADSIVTLWKDQPCWTQKTFLCSDGNIKAWVEESVAGVDLCRNPTLNVRAALQHNYVFSTNYQK